MKPLTFFAKFAASAAASMNKINNQFLMTTGRNHRLALTKSNNFFMRLISNKFSSLTQESTCVFNDAVYMWLYITL